MSTRCTPTLDGSGSALDVHKMEITATVHLCEGEGEPVVETRCFSTLPSSLKEMVAWLTGHGVEAAVMEGAGSIGRRPSRSWRWPGSRRSWCMRVR